jgi:hypothetical protein
LSLPENFNIFNSFLHQLSEDGPTMCALRRLLSCLRKLGSSFAHDMLVDEWV